MEKLAYLIWDSEDGSSVYRDSLRDRLLAKLPAGLGKHGATDLSICVIDSDVERGRDLHITALGSHALVCFWLRDVGERQGCEAVLDSVCGKKAGYLVAESQPLVMDSPGEGERMPGFTLVGCIQPKQGVSDQQFIETWETIHRPLAIDTQSTVGYTRNEVVRPLTADAPPWKGLIHEVFPLDALDDPSVFYDGVGDSERLAENQKRMYQSCVAFIDLDHIDSHPMSEYRFRLAN